MRQRLFFIPKIRQVVAEIVSFWNAWLALTIGNWGRDGIVRPFVGRPRFGTWISCKLMNDSLRKGVTYYRTDRCMFSYWHRAEERFWTVLFFCRLEYVHSGHVVHQDDRPGTADSFWNRRRSESQRLRSEEIREKGAVLMWQLLFYVHYIVYKGVASWKVAANSVWWEIV